jgi:hypothetical protein
MVVNSDMGISSDNMQSIFLFLFVRYCKRKKDLIEGVITEKANIADYMRV